MKTLVGTEFSLVLEDQHCVPKHLQEGGVVFKYNVLKAVLKNLLRESKYKENPSMDDCAYKIKKAFYQTANHV